MKALILASGSGKRLAPLTNSQPKCLTSIQGTTILEYQFKALKKNSIRDVIITTGPFESQILDFIEKFKQDFNFTLVNNKLFDNTNYIYSMHLARQYLNDDILLLHGDLIFENAVLKQLLGNNSKNGVIIELNHRPRNDFKGLIQNGLIKQISVNLEDQNSHFLAPLYKFNYNDFQMWMRKIEEFVAHDKVHCYAEDALNELLPEKLKLSPVYINNSICMEIDEPKDIEKINQIFSTGLNNTL